MSRQIEITFSYGDRITTSRKLRRDVNWAAHLDDLFAGMQTYASEELPLNSGTKIQTPKPELPADKSIT